jgi:hypothetical protein
VLLQHKKIRRLAPDVVNSEHLDEMMQRGYDFEDEGRFKDCCNLWLEVWGHLKKRFTSDMNSIEDAERVFSGTQCLYNWCQDLDMELWNAGLEDTNRRVSGICLGLYRLG